MSGYWQQIEEQLAQQLGKSITFTAFQAQGGGCINQAWRVQDQDGQTWFVKMNQAHLLDMFAVEYQALQTIQQSNTIRVPEPMLYGTAEQYSFLLLEYIDFSARSNAREAGKQLAIMHQVTGERFGWHQDNFIGTSEQKNTQADDWIHFWQQQRLGFQLDLAKHNGFSHKAYDNGLRLQQDLKALFSGRTVKPSLLHGDLWGGNLSYTHEENGSVPVIYDPALYYGDHETDLAMTELFGGFSSDFYTSYREHFPIDQGYAVRKTLYNLYHILNHFNLFGGGYSSQAEGMISRLLSQLK